jgi:WD40 repeat protein
VCPACGGDNEIKTELRNESHKELQNGLRKRTGLLPTDDYSGNYSAASLIRTAPSYSYPFTKTFVLTWTVLLQCCILAGTLLFAVKAGFIPEKHTAHQAGGIAADGLLLPSALPVTPLFATSLPENSLSAISLPESPAASTNPPMLLSSEPALPAVPLPAAESVTKIIEPGMPVETPEETESAENLILPPKPTLADAEALLAQCAEKSQSSPEPAIRNAVAAAKIYETLGQKFPEKSYWLLGRTYTALSWGKVFAEGISPVEITALSNDNRWLLTQQRDKTVRLWNLEEKEGKTPSEFILDATGKQYVRFVFTPDRHWIIGCQTDGTIRIWDMSLKNPAETSAEFREKIPEIADMQISPDGHYLAVRRSLTAGDNLVAGSGSNNNAVRQVAFKAKGKIFEKDTNGSPQSGSQVFLWNLRNLETGLIPSALAITCPSTDVKVLRFSSDSQKLAFGGSDAVVRIYDLSDDGIGSEPKLLRGHLLAVTHIEFAPNGQWLATGSQDNTVRLWNWKSTQLSPDSVVLEGHTGWISVITVDAAGEYVYSGSFDRTVKRWKVNGGKIETAAESGVTINADCGIPERIITAAESNAGNSMVIINGTGGSLFLAEAPAAENQTNNLTQNPTENQTDGGDFITFRNSSLPISNCAVIQNGSALVFCYENKLSPGNSGIRLWHLNTAGILQSVQEIVR